MPIYHYRCEDCEAISEVWAKISDPAPDACPECGGPNLKKAVSRTAFKLSGGGWYAQGYDGQSNTDSSNTSSGSGSGSGDD